MNEKGTQALGAEIERLCKRLDEGHRRFAAERQRADKAEAEVARLQDHWLREYQKAEAEIARLRNALCDLSSSRITALALAPRGGVGNAR